jgi:hypothetical protein
MIRPFTLMTMMLAAASGAYLFGVKHRAQVLDDQLAAVAQNARLDQQRIRVLQAQWALEIDPNRLAKLAAEFSPLQPMKPAQLVTLAALPDMLPPAESDAPARAVAVPLIASNDAAPGPAPDADAAVGTGAQVAMIPTPQAAILPMPPPMIPSAPAPVPPASPTVTRHIVPSPAALRALLAAKTTTRTARLASVSRREEPSNLSSGEWAANLPAPRPLDGAQSPMGARVMSVSASPMAANTVASDAQGGSMLGMASDLAPPQPVGQGTGN